MTDLAQFQDLKQIAATGLADSPEANEALGQLIYLHEDKLRRSISLELAMNPRVRRSFGSSDIFMSVYVRFLVKFRAGRYEGRLETAEDLLRLLRRIAKNRIRTLANTQTVVRPDNDWSRILREKFGGDTPSRVAVVKEAWRQLLDLLTDTEKRLFEMRRDKFSWEEIGQALGISDNNASHKYANAIRRVLRIMDPDPI